MSSAAPLRSVGALLVATLEGQAGDALPLMRVVLNEGAVPVTIDLAGAEFDRDGDGDRQSDWEETLAGTDPGDKRSFMGIREIRSNTDGTRTIAWASVVGKRYRVQFKGTVSEREWTDLEVITASGATTTAIDLNTEDSSQRLYRIQLAE